MLFTLFSLFIASASSAPAPFRWLEPVQYDTVPQFHVWMKANGRGSLITHFTLKTADFATGFPVRQIWFRYYDQAAQKYLSPFQSVECVVDTDLTELYIFNLETKDAVLISAVRANLSNIAVEVVINRHEDRAFAVSFTPFCMNYPNKFSDVRNQSRGCNRSSDPSESLNES